jgi:hydrogenase maturation protease
MRTIVLGIGNELIGDDGAGVVVARALHGHLDQSIDVAETAECGIALLDYLIGYDRAVLIDAVFGSGHPPGSVRVLEPSDFSRIEHPSPHYAGIPELIDVAGRLGLAFPKWIRIVAIEAQDRSTIGAGITPSVMRGVKEAVSHIVTMVRESTMEVPDG